MISVFSENIYNCICIVLIAVRQINSSGIQILFEQSIELRLRVFFGHLENLTNCLVHYLIIIINVPCRLLESRKCYPTQTPSW